MTTTRKTTTIPSTKTDPDTIIDVTIRLRLTVDELESIGILHDTVRASSLEDLCGMALYWFGGTQGYHWPPGSFRR
jgi:hypothetical protein